MSVQGLIERLTKAEDISKRLRAKVSEVNDLVREAERIGMVVLINSEGFSDSTGSYTLKTYTVACRLIVEPR